MLFPNGKSEKIILLIILVQLPHGFEFKNVKTFRLLIFFQNGDHVGKLDGQHPNAVTSLAFNPFFDVIASSCTHMCLWLPDEQYD